MPSDMVISFLDVYIDSFFKDKDIYMFILNKLLIIFFYWQ